MKTSYAIADIELFLSKREGFIPNSVKQLSEGHTSQVFFFELSGKSAVIRIRKNKKDFDADSYAYRNFSHALPIPEVIEAGAFDDAVFYAITPYIAGQTLNTLNKEAFNSALPYVKEAIAGTFLTDISNVTGYCDPDFTTGNAFARTWKESLEGELLALNEEKLRKSAAKIGLPGSSVDMLIKQFNDKLPYVSEYRRLLHGDPGGDNVIINNGSVAALIDWEQLSYGDWLRDFSRFEFWSKNNYGDAEAFARQYNLETDHLHERKAVYWAINALRAIEFADEHGSEKVANWLQSNLKRLLI